MPLDLGGPRRTLLIQQSEASECALACFAMVASYHRHETDPGMLRERFGGFSGRIEAVSRVVLSPAELDAPLKIEEPVYRVTVALDRQSIAAFGERVTLQPGMMLTANIILDRQSFWDWLMNPLRAVRNRT